MSTYVICALSHGESTAYNNDGSCDTGQLMITFNMLPDDVLLGIFVDDEDMDAVFEPFERQRIEEWITLAHVCRRWRSIVLQFPCSLNLRLLCTPKTPARDMSDVWQPLPSHHPRPLPEGHIWRGQRRRRTRAQRPRDSDPARLFLEQKLCSYCTSFTRTGHCRMSHTNT